MTSKANMSILDNIAYKKRKRCGCLTGQKEKLPLPQPHGLKGIIIKQRKKLISIGDAPLRRISVGD